MNAAPMLSQKSSWPSNDECRSWVDGVDKVGDETGGPLKLGFCRSFARRPLWGAARSLTLLKLFAPHAHATHAAWTFGGGRQTWPASVALPADIDLDDRAARMNAFWEKLVEFQHRDVLVVALCVGEER